MTKIKRLKFLKYFTIVILLVASIKGYAQEVTITGKVTDKTGAMPGVNVVVKGTTKGTVTASDGSYEIDAPANGTLVFSFIGMNTKEVEIAGQTTIDVQLETATVGLDEVVAIGYGVMKKSDLTGSVVSIQEDELSNRPAPTLGQAIQGKAAGALVRTNSAAPGGGVSIIIRGHNSVNSSSQPLYVVDGIPLGSIDNIPVEDIKSVEILKDASSTAIYGSRGSNGVVLVTTKKGSVGEPTISYSGRMTMESMPGDLNLMNGQEFATFYTEWEIAQGTEPSQVHYNGSSYDRPLPANVGEGTDWIDVITQNGLAQNHQINVSGGTDKNTYSVSLNYLDHKGLIKGGDYDRFGLKFSNFYEINNWLESGIDLFLTREITNSSGENVSLEDPVFSPISPATKMPPTLPIYNPDGGYQVNNLPSTQNMENPLAAALEYTNLDKEYSAIGMFYLNFKPFEGFSFKVSGGATVNQGKNYKYNPSNTIYGALLNGSAGLRQFSSNYIINENIATYQKQFGDVHKINAIAGFTYEENVSEFMGASGTNFFTDEFKYNNLAAASSYGQPESGKKKWQMASYLGRINYTLKDKYLFTATGRYDGSSRFGKGNKWALFPSVAAAWRISNEPFMESVEDISNLKLRLSWGEAGNSNIGLYKSLATFSLANYPFGNAIQSGVQATNLSNPDLRWETTETYDFAVDFGFFNNRLNVTFDAYYKKTRDLLMNVATIETSGFRNALRNVGELENKGLEIIIATKILDKNDFTWELNGDISFNRNKILELNGDATQSWKIGHPIGVSRDYDYDGIIRTQEDLDAYVDEEGNPIGGAELGDAKRIDQNDDGRISGDDQVIVFNPNPDFTFGFTNNLSYKRFNLVVSFYGSQGNQVKNRTGMYFTQTRQVRNNMSRKLINNYWTPENVDADFPSLSSNLGYGIIQYEDGSFIRLQNVLLSYNLPSLSWLKNASVYVSGQNLLTITNYSGWDPDVNSSEGNQNFGVDRAAYPVPRSFTVGIKTSF